MVRMISILGWLLIVFSLCSLISCGQGDYRVQERLYSFVDQIIADVDSCEYVGRFYEEQIDSISYKVYEYEKLYYDCFFPSIRLLNEDTVAYMVQEMGINESDITYFLIGLTHARRNRIRVDDAALLLIAKEFKYQMQKFVSREDDAYNDLYIDKAQSLDLYYGDRVSVTFYEDSLDLRDSLHIVGYYWLVDTSSGDKLVSVEGVIDQVFRHVEDDYPIYLNLRLDDPIYSNFVWNDSVYTNGSVLPLDLLHYGGEIKQIKKE